MGSSDEQHKCDSARRDLSPVLIRIDAFIPFQVDFEESEVRLHVADRRDRQSIPTREVANAVWKLKYEE